MNDQIHFYCGNGIGRSSAAVGQAVRYACEGKTVFVVRFLKGKASVEYDFLRRLEPEIKVFCFDKFDKPYDDLSPEEQEEEAFHMKNAIAYARKVAATGECDMLVLDEGLELINMGIITADELRGVIESAGPEVRVIITGAMRHEELWPYADRVTEVSTLKLTGQSDEEQSPY